MSHSTYNTNNSSKNLIKSILKDGVSIVNPETIRKQLDESKLCSIQLSELNELITENEQSGILDSRAVVDIRELRRTLKNRVASQKYADKKKKEISSSHLEGVEEKEIELLTCTKRCLENERIYLLDEIEKYKKFLSKET